MTTTKPATAGAGANHAQPHNRRVHQREGGQREQRRHAAHQGNAAQRQERQRAGGGDADGHGGHPGPRQRRRQRGRRVAVAGHAVEEPAAGGQHDQHGVRGCGQRDADERAGQPRRARAHRIGQRRWARRQRRGVHQRDHGDRHRDVQQRRSGDGGEDGPRQIPARVLRLLGQVGDVLETQVGEEDQPGAGEHAGVRRDAEHAPEVRVTHPQARSPPPAPPLRRA